MARWRLEAGPSTTAPVVQLTTARSRKLTFKLTEPSSLTFDVDGRSLEALDLVELATDVHATRDGEVLFTGRLGSTEDTLDDKAHTTSCNVVDTRGLLARRYTTTARNYAPGDTGQFVTDMLNDAQAQVGASPHASALRVTVPTFTAGTSTLLRTSKAGSVILAELQDAQSTGVDDGSALFDWDISPGWSARTARFWPGGRGRDLTSGTSAVILDATFVNGSDGRLRPRSSIVAGVTRKLDPSTYANVYRVSGGSYSVTVPATQADFAVRTADGKAYVSSTSDGGTVKDYTDDTATITVTTTPVTLTDGTQVWDMGVWAMVEDKATDIVTQSALNAYAAKRIAELSRVAPSYSVRLRNNVWGGPSHVWLGDKVRLIIRSGRLFEDVSLRVREVSVGIGDSGEETVDLVVGPDAQPSPLTVLRDQQQALNQLLKAAARGA